jgi:hypothetical protein
MLAAGGGGSRDILIIVGVVGTVKNHYRRSDLVAELSRSLKNHRSDNLDDRHSHIRVEKNHDLLVYIIPKTHRRSGFRGPKAG